VPDSLLLFDVAFAVVLLSLLVQGATVPGAARVLGVEVPPRDEPVDRQEVWVGGNAALELLEYRVGSGSAAEGSHPDDIAVGFGEPGEVRCVAVTRDQHMLRLDSDSRLCTGDSVWFAASDALAEPIARSFSPVSGELSAHAGFFGEFVVDPACLAGDLALNYGFDLPPEQAGLDLQSLMQASLGRRAVVGDRVRIGAIQLSVRSIDAGGRVTGVGLKVSSAAHS